MSRKNLMEIVKKLMVHMEQAEGTLYRDELLTRIVEICSQNNYQFISNFEWYITVLVELTQQETASKYGEFTRQAITAKKYNFGLATMFVEVLKMQF